MLLWLMLQAATPSGLVAAGPVADVRTPVRPLTCAPVGADEIAVCGRGQQSPYRLQRLEPPPPDRPLRAAADLGGGKRVALVAESKELPGAISRRAMVKVTIPF